MLHPLAHRLVGMAWRSKDLEKCSKDDQGGLPKGVII